MGRRGLQTTAISTIFTQISLSLSLYNIYKVPTLRVTCSEVYIQILSISGELGLNGSHRFNQQDVY